MQAEQQFRALVPEAEAVTPFPHHGILVHVLRRRAEHRAVQVQVMGHGAHGGVKIAVIPPVGDVRPVVNEGRRGAGGPADAVFRRRIAQIVAEAEGHAAARLHLYRAGVRVPVRQGVRFKAGTVALFQAAQAVVALEKQIGRDTLADYKLFAENGRTLEHSIGVKAIKRDSIDPCKVLEWRMMEYSTLTSWGSNPQTFLVNIKSATADQVKEAVDFVRKAFLQHGYSDERLKGYDMELSLLLKSLNGGAVVSCPHCGYQFDYDAETEHTFAQQVLDYAADYQRWITQDIVREEMEKLTPEIRTQVISLIDSVKSEKKEFTQKGLQDLMNYVRCPHCWGKVYRSNAILQNTSENTTGKNEPSVDTQEKNDGENGNDEVTIKAADNGTLLDFKSLNSCFENK